MLGNSTTDREWSFMTGEGEMAGLIRGKDWSCHPLGRPAQWPETLKILLATVLASRAPMFLWWGQESYCFYNDAYRPSLGDEGRHPDILGRAAQEAWPDIWTTIGPLIHQVLSGGESVWSEDQLIPILRNGRLEDVYWTFSYSAVRDATGVIRGVLVTCSETTEKVRALAEMKENAQRLTSVLEQAPVAVAIFTGPEHTVELVNNRALSIWGRARDQVIGRPLLEALPELMEQGCSEYMDEVLRGSSFSATELAIKMVRKGHLEELYVNLSLEPLRAGSGTAESLIAVGVEVTETVLAKQRAEAGEARFRLLADSMPQFVWTGDAQGNLNYFNRTVYDYSGLSAEEVAVKGWLQIVHPDEQEANVAAWTAAVNSGVDFFFEHRFKHRDGTYRWQMSRARPLRNAEGRINMWVGTSTDIQAMKEQDAEKDYFIGMAGHELRNPLNTLRGCIDLMQLDMDDGSIPELVQVVEMMDRQVSKLTRLISDLLDISKLKSGSMDMELSRFDVNMMVRNVVEEMRSSVPDHIFNLNLTEPVLVDADRFRVSQVLGNLLTNAVKYAPGQKEVDITCSTADGFVQVAVKDRGVGIRAEDQRQVFERFYRVQGESTKGILGFGIGLYVAADIIKRHGGTMEVKSAEGKGSTFSFKMPLVPAGPLTP